MNLKGIKVNFLGDSITEGVGTSAPENIYLNVLAEKYGFAEARNYGIGGTRIARQTGAMREGNDNDNNMCARVYDMDPDADLVVLFGGTNDFGHGDAPLGDNMCRTRDTYTGACHEVMNNLIERFPEAVIVILTPLHRWNESNMYGDCRINFPADLNEYRKILMDVAMQHSVPVCDLYSISGIDPSNEKQKELFMPDGLHPSDRGNARIAERIGAFLETL